jgi:hypothetical protein
MKNMRDLPEDDNVKKHNPEDAEEVLLFTATLAGLILVTILWQ